MTNRQWLLEKIQNMSDEEFGELFSGTTVICDLQEPNCPCESNDTTCTECKANWLKAEHKEPIKLSDAERVILENIDKKYKWLCRDNDGCLNAYIGKPKKQGICWVWDISYGRFDVFNHLFQFIKWEDKEAYNIEELLKGE